MLPPGDPTSGRLHPQQLAGTAPDGVEECPTGAHQGRLRLALTLGRWGDWSRRMSLGPCLAHCWSKGVSDFENGVPEPLPREPESIDTELVVQAFQRFCAIETWGYFPEPGGYLRD